MVCALLQPRGSIPQLCLCTMDTRTPTTAANTPKVGRDVVHQPSASTTRDAYANLAGALGSLAGNYDALHGQTMQIALLGTEIGNAQDVKEFRQQIREQDLRHKEGIAEIQNIIDHILRNEGDEMKTQVNQEIANQIDEIVKDQVAQCLKEHIPEDLQLEIAKNKQEYEELQLALHNSEARRLNGTLRANNPDETLHTIYMSNGSISPRFPKDLGSLFDLDADTVRALMVDYGLTSVSNIRDVNLNKFMQFCGVRYQLVVTIVKADSRNTNTTNAAY
ncbi:hypothetical protein P691DRAFT_778668 [Macrolepiota fuliginosa MF-IS2]|uniref:Uncharacterized protein n=1 Tax=Macrolepiota fuliginosa MF-IS2 TaxID=1400762 RepID=A0A9P5X396_9AGAR|nr:hypothetical protein P691DRAFT_778668 [Macrolepiota fuliginosa MF-IS2]